MQDRVGRNRAQLCDALEPARRAPRRLAFHWTRSRGIQQASANRAEQRAVSQVARDALLVVLQRQEEIETPGAMAVQRVGGLARRAR